MNLQRNLAEVLKGGEEDDLLIEEVRKMLTKGGNPYYEDNIVVICDHKTGTLIAVPLFPDEMLQEEIEVHQDFILHNKNLALVGASLSKALVHVSIEEVYQLLKDIIEKERNRDPLYCDKLAKIIQQIEETKFSPSGELLDEISYLLSPYGVRDRLYLKYGMRWEGWGITSGLYDHQMKSWSGELIMNPFELAGMDSSALIEIAKIGEFPRLKSLKEVAEEYLCREVNKENFLAAIRVDWVPYLYLKSEEWRFLMKQTRYFPDDGFYWLVKRAIELHQAFMNIPVKKI